MQHPPGLPHPALKIRGTRSNRGRTSPPPPARRCAEAAGFVAGDDGLTWYPGHRPPRSRPLPRARQPICAEQSVVNPARVLPVSRQAAASPAPPRDTETVGHVSGPPRGPLIARRDLEDDDALSTGATDTELPGPPRSGALHRRHVRAEIDGDLDDDVKVHVACRESRRGGGRTGGARYRRALRAEFNDSAAAAAASPGAEEGADAGFGAVDHAGAVDYSGAVVEDRSAGQDAAADQGLSG